MLLTKEVEVSVSPRTVGHYKNKGYLIPMKYSEKSKKEIVDIGCKITVKVEDLPNSSHVQIKCQCDNCGKVFTTTYHNLLSSKYPELGNLCKECATKIKLPQAMRDKYGVSNCANAPSIIEKRKQTNLKRYGNEWAIASNEVKESIRNTCVQKFGCENPMQDEVVKQKAMVTINKKYGGNSCFCSEEIKAKSQETCLKRYGVKNAFQSKEVQAKARKTLYNNGSVPTSKAEQKMCKMLEVIFGQENCFPSFPVSQLSLDCLVIINEQKIDFEYDGLFWHKNRKQKDIARNAVLMNKGYKIVRIKANNRDSMPTEEQILQAVDYLVKDNHHLTFIDMNK